MHHAAKRGHLGCITALLEYEVNLDLKNSKGKTALDVAEEGETGDCKKSASYIVKKMSKISGFNIFNIFMWIFFTFNYLIC